MAVLYRCDVCLHEFTDRNDLRTLKLPHTNGVHRFSDLEEDGYSKDLCIDCFRPIIDLTKSKPKTKPA